MNESDVEEIVMEQGSTSDIFPVSAFPSETLAHADSAVDPGGSECDEYDPEFLDTSPFELPSAVTTTSSSQNAALLGQTMSSLPNPVLVSSSNLSVTDMSSNDVNEMASILSNLPTPNQFNGVTPYYGASVPKSVVYNEKSHETNQVFYTPPLEVVSSLIHNARLFVSHIGKATKESLANVFAIFGTIYEITIRSNYAYIQFATVSACQNAISQMNNTLIKESPQRLDCKVADRPYANMNDNPSDIHMFHPLHTVYYHPTPGAMSKVPTGSRLFLGGISADQISKQDIASVFAKYGNICEISSKGTFGFVQFDSAIACTRAIQNENGRVMNGFKIDCKMSKDKSLNDKTNNTGAQSRNKKRPNTRSRSRSRSYSPMSSRRSVSPRRQSENVPLARRPLSQIPDIQIISLDNISRQYINSIVSTFSTNGVSATNMYLSPRMSLKNVVNQFVDEGVKGIILLERTNERNSDICLQIFTANNGMQEYDGIRLGDAVKIVQREKSSRSSSVPDARAPLAVNANVGTVLESVLRLGGEYKTICMVATALGIPVPALPPTVAPIPVFPVQNVQGLQQQQMIASLLAGMQVQQTQQQGMYMPPVHDANHPAAMTHQYSALPLVQSRGMGGHGNDSHRDTSHNGNHRSEMRHSGASYQQSSLGSRDEGYLMNNANARTSSSQANTMNPINAMNTMNAMNGVGVNNNPRTGVQGQGIDNSQLLSLMQMLQQQQQQ